MTNSIHIQKHYLSDKNIPIYQPQNGYKAGLDALLLASSLDKNTSKIQKIADLGAGVGTISIILANRLTNIKIVAFEIQSILHKLMTKNISLNNLDDIIIPLQQDIFRLNSLQKEYLKNNIPLDTIGNDQFHHVLCNPPYYHHSHGNLPQNQIKKIAHILNKESSLQQWILTALRLLKAGGMLYMINLAQNLDEIIATLHGKAGKIEIFQFFSHNYASTLNHTANRVIVRAVKGKRGPLKIYRPLIIHCNSSQDNNSNNYSHELQQILFKLRSLSELF